MKNEKLDHWQNVLFESIHERDALYRSVQDMTVSHNKTQKAIDRMEELNAIIRKASGILKRMKNK